MRKNRKNRVEYLPFKELVDLRLYSLEDREFYTLWRAQESYFEHLQFLEKMKQIKTFVPDKNKMAQEKAQYENAIELLVGKEIKTPELL
jgi:hypothetical protein